ncbi:hypothetical protein [uncultured Oscillibacter sp.]|uniref:hypothetical protein n=1 Tax=uncultured Oscillibacter sp. TaxID=876091 RepID=UPI00280ADE21|nr:hypothetical protein [uncultured Oscillibacter sp.]
MLSEENKKNLDSFKIAMRQEVGNAGYFLEDIPDMIQEKSRRQKRHTSSYPSFIKKKSV